MTIGFRQAAHKRDWGWIGRLTSSCFPDLGEYGEKTAALLADPSVVGIVAKKNGRSIGFALVGLSAQGRRWHPGCWEAGPPAAVDAELLMLAVGPAHRRRGVGTLLMRRALQLIAAAGAENVQANMAAENEPIQRLCGAAGFRLVAENDGTYSNGASVVRMALVA